MSYNDDSRELILGFLAISDIREFFMHHIDITLYLVQLKRKLKIYCKAPCIYIPAWGRFISLKQPSNSTMILRLAELKQFHLRARAKIESHFRRPDLG